MTTLFAIMVKKCYDDQKEGSLKGLQLERSNFGLSRIAKFRKSATQKPWNSGNEQFWTSKIVKISKSETQK